MKSLLLRTALVLALIFGLVACGGGDSSDPSANPPKDSSEQPKVSLRCAP